MILNGTEKSALLLMSIGAEQAAAILKNLTSFEVQELITCMVNINHFSSENLNKILFECYNTAVKNDNFNCNNNNNYLMKMLTKALGEKKGHSLLQRALEIRNAKTCINILNSMKPHKVAMLLDKEHLQVVTIILICLDVHQSAEVLEFLNDEKRAEIILRITKFNGVEESTLLELTKVINDLLNGKKIILSDKGGIKTAASILNSMKVPDERAIINKISIFNQHLAENLMKEMFLFENIVDLDDKYIKHIIDNIEKEKLYIALQNTNVCIRKKFFKNMSEAESNQLSKSLEKKSYISNNSVENEQKLILMMIKSIKNKKNISLKNLGKYYA